MANFGRRIFEREILSVDSSTVAYGTPPTAKERYMTLMEENPELLQDVPLKYLASYLYITPQSLSRIRAGLKKSKDLLCQDAKRLLADYFCKSLFISTYLVSSSPTPSPGYCQHRTARCLRLPACQKTERNSRLSAHGLPPPYQGMPSWY